MAAGAGAILQGICTTKSKANLELRPGETGFGQWSLGEAEAQGAEEASGFHVQVGFMGTEPVEGRFGVGRLNEGFAFHEVIEDQGGGEGVAGEAAKGNARP